MSKRRYSKKKYLGPVVDADTPLPKTTKWRYRTQGAQDQVGNVTQSGSVADTSVDGFGSSPNDQLNQGGSMSTGEQSASRSSQRCLGRTPYHQELYAEDQIVNDATFLLHIPQDASGSSSFLVGKSNFISVSTSVQQLTVMQAAVMATPEFSSLAVDSHGENLCEELHCPSTNLSASADILQQVYTSGSDDSEVSEAASEISGEPGEEAELPEEVEDEEEGDDDEEEQEQELPEENNGDADGGQDGAAEDQPPPEDEDPQRGPENGDYDQNPSHPRLRRKMHGDFDPVIDTPVNVSRNDALYMALGLARREKFSNVALCNAAMLINALFAAPVLPSTKDLLDGLLVSNLGCELWFFCAVCYKSFGQLDYKRLRFYDCPMEGCGTRNVISDLRVANFFVIFSIPHQLQNLLTNAEIRNALLTPAEAVATVRPGFISDIWGGAVYKKFAAAVADIEHVFSFHFCVDGSPLVVTSLLSIWPILLQLQELPAKLRMSNLLLGGLWFGKKPAKMDLFLKPFVEHFRRLSEGFNIKMGDNVVRAHAFCTGCCVDSGARGKVQGIKTHSGYHSCNWCVIAGEWIGGAVKFPMTMGRPRDRTHEEIVRLQNLLVNNPAPEDPPIEEDIDENVDEPGIPEAEQHLLGVNAVSPLINMPYFGHGANQTPTFDMVNGFFVDSMHMLDLGVSKYFLTRWMDDYGHDYYIRPSSEEIDRRIDALRPPLEFRKVPRKLNERARYSARELQNWMMFSCVPVLTGVLREKYLKHWLHLIQALYILNQNEVSFEDLNKADTLVNWFLIQTEELYDRGDMTFNLHILKHLVTHTFNNGSSWATNSYSFEDGNGKLKRIIHSSLGVPHQVIRNLSWDESFKILEEVVSQKAKDYVSNITQTKHEKQRSVSIGTARLIGKPEELRLSAEEAYQCERNHHVVNVLERYKKLVYDHCTFTDNCDRSSRFDNSVAQLVDKSIVLARKIFLDLERSEVFLLVSDVNFDVLLVPPPGLHLEHDSHFMRKITFIDEELRYIKCSELRTVCFRATMPGGDFLAPLPNVHNRH